MCIICSFYPPFILCSRFILEHNLKIHSTIRVRDIISVFSFSLFFSFNVSIFLLYLMLKIHFGTNLEVKSILKTLGVFI